MRAVVVCALMGAAALAGCGGGDDAPRETRDSDRGPVLQRGGPDPEAFKRFEDCLRENGVEPPRPSDGGPAIVQPPPEDVRRKCERFLPEGGPPVGPGPAPQQAPLPQSPGP